jgi:succinate dehydrogenase hydrophobic anchor subunit
LNLDYLMWLFTRLSALGLAFLALVGFVSALVMGARTQMDLSTLMRWTFFPNFFHVTNIEIPDELLWANAYWQTIQVGILVLGGTHGINGLRMVLEDYLGISFRRIVLRFVFFLLWVGMMSAAVYLVLAA